MNWWLLSAIVYVVFVYLWSYECIGYHNLGNSLLCWQMGYGCFKSWHFILLFSFIFFLLSLLSLAWCCTCWRVIFYRSLWFWYVVLCNKLGWNHHCHPQKTDETLPNPSWADLVCTTLLSALSPLPAVIRAVSNGASLFFYCVSLFPIVLERPHSSF